MAKAPSDAADTLLYQRIGDAIRVVRGELTQTHLADLIGSEQSTISDYEVARARVPLHVVPAIEEACGVRRGTILRLAGLIDEDMEAALGSDPALSEYGREATLAFYVFTRDRFRPGQAD